MRILLCLVFTSVLATTLATATTPQYLSTIVDGEVTATLTKSPSSPIQELEFQIKAPKLKLQSVFVVRDPLRLVIDVDPIGLRVTDSVTVTSNPLVACIRTGKHSDKTRFVLDLHSESSPTYRWKVKGNTAIITLSPPIPTPPEQTTPKGLPVAIPTIQDLPVETSISVVTPQPTQEHVTNTAPLESPSVAPTETQPLAALNMAKVGGYNLQIIPTAEPTQLPAAGQALQSIRFGQDQHTQEPALTLQLTERPMFTLAKVSARNYELSIPECSLVEEHLLLPYFPPLDFEGLTMVQPTQSGNSLRIMIGTDRDAELSAVTRNNEIVVKAKLP